MDDAELTRLAIQEIVREMGELKEPQVQERKVNPLGRPNKRFLDRTLNSMMSHNRRENERTRANCREMLKELDARRCHSEERMCDSRRHEHRRRTRSKSSELIFSSSTEESSKYKKRRHKKRSKKLKKKKKKRKNSRRKSRSRSKSRDKSKSRSRSSTSSSSGKTPSRSYNHSRQRNLHKLWPNNHKIGDTYNNDVETVQNVQNYGGVAINEFLQFDMALASTTYNQQVRQMLYYRTMMERVEMDAMQQELQLEDILNEQSDKKSNSSAISVISLNEPEQTNKKDDDGDGDVDVDGDSDSDSVGSSNGGIYTIPLISSSSDESSHQIHTRRKKRNARKEINSSLDKSSSSSSIIFDLSATNSNSSHHLTENNKTDVNAIDCISLDSDSKPEPDVELQEEQLKTVTLLSSTSESEDNHENENEAEVGVGVVQTSIVDVNPTLLVDLTDD